MNLIVNFKLPKKDSKFHSCFITGRLIFPQKVTFYQVATWRAISIKSKYFARWKFKSEIRDVPVTEQLPLPGIKRENV